MKKIAFIVLGGFLSWMAFPALGQEEESKPVCQLSDTIDSCLRALVAFEVPVAEMAERAAESSSEEAVDTLDPIVAKKLASFDSIGSLLGTDAKSLLDLFAIAIEDAQVNEETGAVTLTWNSQLFGLSGTDEARHNRIQLQTVLNKATLFEPLKQAIPEAERAARVAVLEEDLEDLDDVSLNLTYSRENKRFGRTTDSQRTWLQEVMKWQIAGPQEAHQILNSRLQWVRELLENRDLNPAQTTLNDVLDLVEAQEADEGDAQEDEEPKVTLPAGLHFRGTAAAATRAEKAGALLEWFQVAREAEEKLEKKIQTVLSGETLPRFANLLNNQPEFTGSLIYRARNELTGPDTFSLKVTFKTGLANVNWIRKELDKACQASWSEDCQTDYQTLMDGNEERIDKPWNIVFDLEYKHSDDYDFTIPAPAEDDMEMEMMAEPLRKMEAIPFSLAKTDEVIASFSASKVLRSNNEGVQTAGLAFNVNYNFVDNENDQNIMGKQERLVASLTYTQRINDQFSLPIGLVWANKGEFLPEVDEKFSVNFGLKFRLTKNDS